MALYARDSRRRRWQATADLFVLGWLVVWGFAGLQVWRAVMRAAEPTRRMAETTTHLREDLAAAGRDAAGIPMAGEQLRRPFDSAAASLQPMIDATWDQVRTLEQLAVALGLLVFGLPAVLMLLTWLPARLRFLRRSREVTALLDSGADLDLLALRALATQPMTALARVGPDPLGQWRAGHWKTIVALADLELGDAGVGVPSSLKEDPPERFGEEP